MSNNNNQSHELPNVGLSNQQLLSSLNANSAAGGGNATSTNISTTSAAANNNTNSLSSNSSNCIIGTNNTTNNQQGIINIPLSQLPSPTLCASCDKCRQRKTKCDGNRPCLNCITRYRKSHKLDVSASLEGIDYSQFDCIYSPAKRRGPVPGKTSKGSSRVPSSYPFGITSASQYNALQQQQNQFGGMNNNMGTFNPQIQQLTQAINNGTFSSDELKQMLALQQQLLITQQNSMLSQQGMVGGAGLQQQQSNNMQGVLLNNMLQQQQQQQQGMALGGVGMNNNGMNNINNMTNLQNMSTNNETIPGLMDVNGNIDMNVLQSLTDQQLGIQMQLQQQQQMPDTNNNLMSMNNNQQQQQQQQQQFMIPNNQMSMSPQLGMTMDQQNVGLNHDGPSAKRVHMNGDVVSTPDPSTIDGLPPSVIKHLPLLQLNNSNGTLLRSYYELSTNDILHLPRIPTDSEYCTLLSNQNQQNGCIQIYNLPTYDQSALYAARFSEVALGALANNQISLALELSNASVMCLRNCCFVDDDENQEGHVSCAMYNVARAYLLHGIFRSFRGDMVRYFKYRRVCMTLIQQMDNEPQVDALLAAISFHDAWTYMMHNASEDALPEIDGAIPKLNNNDGSCPARNANEVVMTKYGCDTHPSSVAADPDNQMWMQGPPPVFLNNEAHFISRSLDAFACAVRSCCDQANASFEGMAKASGVDILGNGKGNVAGNGNDASSTSTAIPTPTTTAVMANENELCSRNIVMSAKTLLDQHWAVTGDSNPKRHGLNMMVHALSAFLEKDPPDPSKQEEQLSSSSVDGSEEGGGGSSGEEEGFSESQIQNLMAACDIVIQHPLLLHCPGPIYHMSSNAAIMLCHLLNGIQAKCDAATRKRKDDGTSPPPGDDDAEMINGMSMLFDQVLDTFMSMRKILNLHRQNLPPKLRCHGIPRPSGLGPFKKSSNESSGEDTQQQPFIELGDTLMCLCRGCQGFVLMGCSPCVAAERTMKTALDHALDTNNGEVTDLRVEGDWGPLEDMALDDDYLLDILSKFNN